MYPFVLWIKGKAHFKHHFSNKRILSTVIVFIYCRTPCKYPGQKIAFHVNEGSTPFWLSLLVEFEDAEGDIGSMHIREVHLSSVVNV